MKREVEEITEEEYLTSKAKQSHEKGNKRIRRETCKMTQQRLDPL